MIYIHLGGFGLQEADKARPGMLGKPASRSSLPGKASQAQRPRRQAGQASQAGKPGRRGRPGMLTHLGRWASSGSTFDGRAKALFLSLAMQTMCFVRQASSGSETTRQAGEAIKTPLSFRSTSVERERNDGGVCSKHLWCQFSFS